MSFFCLSVSWSESLVWISLTILDVVFFLLLSLTVLLQEVLLESLLSLFDLSGYLTVLSTFLGFFVVLEAFLGVDLEYYSLSYMCS